MNRIFIKKIIIPHKKGNFLSYCLNNNESNYYLEILAEWFTDDVRNHSVSWKEWFNDQSEAAETTESNATWLEKDWLDDGSCIVTFGSTVNLIQAPKNQIYVPKDEEFFSMPKENVLELLDMWDLLRIKLTSIIVITEENGVYSMFETDLPENSET